ncbi:hypothetical protein CYLTODRAFT_15560 [Cylindrobasidium torrendii FP15055 ss-10]|uniref:Uncharacterized protein n=1 Tax=Cylindrobasidium torrendii FP15055 ss-10 TaxID=1314674 RepID=A0A0D7B944_9AGAR|nr:hypothetical protein CYLTODRAFT_15560 [Cylindrobasidium torrendii FP15055 ss-10]
MTLGAFKQPRTLDRGDWRTCTFGALRTTWRCGWTGDGHPGIGGNAYLTAQQLWLRHAPQRTRLRVIGALAVQHASHRTVPVKCNEDTTKEATSELNITGSHKCTWQT